MIRERPNSLTGKTHRQTTGCGSIYITVNTDDDTGYPIEVFVTIGKAGGCASAQSESIGRLVSMWLRSGGELPDMVKSLSGIRCNTSDPDNGIYSCADAVSMTLKYYLLEGK